MIVCVVKHEYDYFTFSPETTNALSVAMFQLHIPRGATPRGSIRAMVRKVGTNNLWGAFCL